MDPADRFYVDAHLHLQDPRFEGQRETIVANMLEAGVVRWAVNSTSEADWHAVGEEARREVGVTPCFGLHPWWIKSRRAGWQDRLRGLLTEHPNAGVGEIGLDKWIRDHDLDDQEAVFRTQLEIAVELGRPAMIHCLQCFGRLREVLADSALPNDFRFLLHSYGGPKEMVAEFVELGAYFSFSGYFLEARKTATREAFAEVPLDRLLIESDAPDMPLPRELEQAHLPDSSDGKRVNHPANLPVIYREVAKLRGMKESELIRRVARNFSTMFGDEDAG